MAITFVVAKNRFPDNVASATTATAIQTWLNTLSVTTVHGLQIEHVQGFWEVIIVYV